jgi:addiction module HigA family antidote
MAWDYDLPAHPGDYIVERMEASELGLEEYCAAYGLDVETIRAVIHRHAPVTDDLADDLEKATGLRAYIWMGLQRRWDERQRIERSA